MDIISLKPLIGSIVYAVLGIVILLVTYYLVEKITPEDTWKEISQNNNVAIAVVFAALIIGISMIISAAIHG